MKGLLLALAAAALLGCGGDEVRFDLENPPQWLKDLDGALPAKALRRDELAGECLERQFTECTAHVAPSRAMTRKAKFALRQGKEVRITYAAEGANPVTVTLRGDPATVPVRRGGGTMTFHCASFNGCMVELVP